MRWLAWLTLLLAALPAAACSYARDVHPERWQEWAAALFSGSVTAVQSEQEKQRPVDVITLRVVETFKGPAGASATLRMPERVRLACGLPLPRAGDELLVGLDADGNTAWVPLKPAYVEALRKK
jgi:hypothetical protein